MQLAVIDKISFTVKSGKITAIFGPNGCGKTTLLKIIAGLISSDKGSIELNNKSSEKNKIGFVFQNYSSSLFPWWKVWENIGLNLKIKGILSVDIKRQVENLLVKTGIALPLENYPYVLSGGQQQLCAILRELINSPALLLLDEPFASLDYHNRILFEEKFLQLIHPQNIPTIIISHDVEESIYLADEVIVVSARPASILKKVKITLPRPRKNFMRISKEFTNLRNEILKHVAVK